MNETPLILLESLSSKDKRIYAKLENQNPTGSIKDRMASFTLEALLAERKITKDTTIVEASSGNTGIALSKACSDLGLKCIICMAEHISDRKKKKIEENGAELKLFECRDNPGAEISAARELGKKPGFYFFNQFENPYHLKAYRETLCHKLLEQLDSSGVIIDYFVAGVGSGASIRAIGELLKEEHNPDLKVFAIRPDSFPTKIEGVHPGQILGDFPIWEERAEDFVEQQFFLKDSEAAQGRELLLTQEELSVGYCSGALIYVVRELIDLEGSYLLLFTDSGDRY